LKLTEISIVHTVAKISEIRYLQLKF